jgi:uncharacterized protein (DUF4415 family)
MSKAKQLKASNADTRALMQDLEEALKEAKNAEYARVSSPQEIAKRGRGRPVQVQHKQPVTLRLPPEILADWRASGKGWQTRAAEVLTKFAPR